MLRNGASACRHLQTRGRCTPPVCTETGLHLIPAPRSNDAFQCVLPSFLFPSSSSLPPLLYPRFFASFSIPFDCSFFYLRKDHASAARSSRPFDLFSVKPPRRIRLNVSVARENAVQRDDGATNSSDSWKSGAERGTDRSW